MNETNTNESCRVKETPLTGNKYNPTQPSKFGGVIPAPAYAEWRKVQKPKPVSARRAHREEVKAKREALLR